MATEAQVEANRRNAQKSTGPRTAEGKAAVSQNAVKHGFAGMLDVIRGEEQAEFDLFREQMLEELAPAGVMETMLAERIVSLSWRLRRAERMQSEAFEALLTPDTSNLAVRITQSFRSKRPQEEKEAEEELAFGRAVVKDFGHSRVLDRLLMYERRMEHSLYRTMAELQRLRLLREVDGPAEPVRSGPGTVGAGLKPARTASEEVSGVRLQVSSGGSQLQTPDFQLPTSPETPDGVTTNTSEEVGRERSTPEQVEGRLYEETPDGVSTNGPPAGPPHHSNLPSFQDSSDAPDAPAAAAESCKTKPICPGRRREASPC